jgi:hypothetical protein
MTYIRCLYVMSFIRSLPCHDSRFNDALRYWFPRMSSAFNGNILMRAYSFDWAVIIISTMKYDDGVRDIYVYVGFLIGFISG